MLFRGVGSSPVPYYETLFGSKPYLEPIDSEFAVKLKVRNKEARTMDVGQIKAAENACSNSLCGAK